MEDDTVEEVNRMDLRVLDMGNVVGMGTGSFQNGSCGKRRVQSQRRRTGYGQWKRMEGLRWGVIRK